MPNSDRAAEYDSRREVAVLFYCGMVADQIPASKYDSVAQARIRLNYVTFHHEAVRAQGKARPHIGFRADEARQSVATLDRHRASLRSLLVQVAIADGHENVEIGRRE